MDKFEDYTLIKHVTSIIPGPGKGSACVTSEVNA